MKTKKIVGIISICLVGLIACCIILGAFVPKNFSLNIEDPNSIVVYKKSGNSDFVIESGEEKYDKILELFKSGFHTSYLNSFFQGTMLSSVSTQFNSYANLSKSNLESKDDVIYLDFRYFNEQNVNRNGNNESISAEKLKYRSIVIEIKKTSSMTLINAYTRQNNESTSYVKYQTYASHYNLFNYVLELNY